MSEMSLGGTLPARDNTSRLVVNRSALEYKERQDMTKKAKSRIPDNWGEHAHSISGQPKTKIIEDGSILSRASGRRLREMMREQLLEQEVRMLLKQKLRIFSKEIQNLLKRGIDYVKPLEQAASINMNSMRKEQLKKEYAKYVKMIMKDRFLE